MARAAAVCAQLKRRYLAASVLYYVRWTARFSGENSGRQVNRPRVRWCLDASLAGDGGRRPVRPGAPV